MSSSPPEETPPEPTPQFQRASTTSTSNTNATATANAPVQATEQQLKARAEGVSIEDYLLPRSQTVRLAKSVLPPNTSIQKDAVLAIQKAATVFVSYLSSQANEATLKRTVSPADVLNAISELEFEGFRPRLERELDLFQEMKAAKRRGSGKKGDEAANGETQAQDRDQDQNQNHVQDQDQPDGQVIGTGKKTEVVVRGVKRVKRDGAEAGRDQEEDDEDEVDEHGDEEEVVDEDDHDEEHDENATEEEDDEEDEPVEDDIDRVEDLDTDARARRMDPDAGDDTDSDGEGPESQSRGGLGLG
ncbi:histone-fold-containing protein [Aspergillus californicus]